MLLVDLSNEMSTLLTLIVDVPLLQLETPLVLRISDASTDGRSKQDVKATRVGLHMVVDCLANERVYGAVVTPAENALFKYVDMFHRLYFPVGDRPNFQRGVGFEANGFNERSGEYSEDRRGA